MKVLVIEDERKIREYLVAHLQPQYYEVDTASDGKKGLEMMRLTNYDVVILDNVLPEKSGLEVCKEARTHGVQSPILVLSVLSEPLDKVKLLQAGADDYMAKPFSFQELQARMNALIRRPLVIEDEVITLGALELNTSTHEVTLNGREVPLTRKEFILLCYFMRNPGLVLTRSMLISHVWDRDTDPFSNTIEAHIVSLRKKLNDKEQKIIKTVQGRGYKIAR